MVRRVLLGLLRASMAAFCLLAASGGTRASDTQQWIREFHFSTDHAGPSVVFAARDGSVWVALARAGRIAEFKSDSEVREYNLPSGAFPVGIVRDSGRYLYASDIKKNQIVQVDIHTSATREFAIQTPNSWPFFLSMAPDGRVWFSERVGNKIGVLDPNTGSMNEYTVPTPQAQPAGLAVTPDGEVYFTENTGHKIGHVDPRTGALTEQSTPSKLRDSPYYGLAGITSDAKGDVWFSELDGRICHIDRHAKKSADVIREIPLPNPAVRPAGVAVDAWGIVWFTELDGNGIGSYNPTLDAFDEYSIPTGSPDPIPMGPPEATARGEMPTVGFRARTSRPFGIAADASGRIWFSEQYAHQLGRLDVPVLRIFQPSGRITSATTELKLQARTSDGHSAIKLDLNGIAAPFSHTVDLTGMPGGEVELHASVMEHGKLAESTARFVFDPGIGALQKSLENAKHSSLLSTALYDQCSREIENMASAESAGDLRKVHDIEEALIRLLSPTANVSVTPDIFLKQLKWLDRFGVHDEVVQGGSKLKHLTVEVGDSVEWKTATFRRASMPVSVQPCDSASDALPHTDVSGSKIVFHKAGRFAYAFNGSTECSGDITVLPRELLIDEFPLQNSDSVPGVLSVDSRGNVWFTEGGGGYSKLTAVPLNNKIGCLRPDGTIREYETPTADSAPTSIHVGAEGHVWFTERAGNNIGELIPDSGEIHEYAIPTPRSGTTGITVDHKGTVWFASKGSSKIGFLDPNTKRIREIPTPTPASQPSTITIDENNDVWFDERANDKIVRYQVAADKMTEYSVPTKGSRTVGLVPDRKGHVYFLELGANKVGKLNVETADVTEYQIPTAFASPFKEALDDAGRLWFTEVFGNKIGMLQDGKITEYEIPTAEAMPGGITIDLRGNIWFSEQAGNKIARIPGLLSFAHLAVYDDDDSPDQHRAPGKSEENYR